MTSQEKYLHALQDLLSAQKEVQADESNPFNLNLPTHLGLDDKSFITDDELQKFGKIIGNAASDNQTFSKLWSIGTDILIKAKALLL